MTSRNRHYFAFISLVALAFVSVVLLIHDNTDHGSRSYNLSGAQVRMFSTQNKDMMDTLKQENEEKMASLDRLIQQMSGNVKNICLKDPKATNTPKEQLQSFIEGDCSPVIIVPGFLATRLMVEIDCEELQENHPEIMEACGWSTCSWSLWSKKPASEYLLWIADFLSPVSMLSFSNSTCFGRIAQMHRNGTENHVHPKGIKVTWHGNTPQTKSKADGGLGAITDILPVPLQTMETRGFKGIGQYLKSMGYQTGLTLFAIPYNFLATYVANEVGYTLERTVRYVYELTGKKVVIVSHSLGNLNTLPMLNRMSQEDKDRMIAAYTAIAPPYGGVPISLLYAIGGNPSFQFGLGFGVDFFNQVAMSNGASVTQDMLPKDAFYRFRKEPWMQELLKRIDLEKRYDPRTEEGKAFWSSANAEDLPFSFFPSPAEKCFEGYSSRIDECYMGLSDLVAEPVGIINGEKYYANRSSMKEMIDKHYTMSNITDFVSLWHDSAAGGVEKMINPGVPVFYFFGSHLPTDKRYEWDYVPENNTRQGLFAFPTRAVKGLGDGTVENSFSLPIALKWAWENIHLGEKANAKPVKIVEFCSSYPGRRSFWEGGELNGSRFMSSSSYMGYPCQCGEGKKPATGKDCAHAGIVNDPYIIKAIGEIARTGHKAALKETTAGFKVSNDILVKYIETLPSLTRPKSDQDVSIWLNPQLQMDDVENSRFTY